MIPPCCQPTTYSPPTAIPLVGSLREVLNPGGEGPSLTQRATGFISCIVELFVLSSSIVPPNSLHCAQPSKQTRGPAQTNFLPENSSAFCLKQREGRTVQEPKLCFNSRLPCRLNRLYSKDFPGPPWLWFPWRAHCWNYCCS